MKQHFQLDERSRSIIHRICTTMYLITIGMIMVALVYRQFVLGQSSDAFDDLAMIMTVNAFALLSAVLYFAGLSFEAISPLRLLGLYIGFVALGFGFTMVKYLVLLDQPLDGGEILEKLGIIGAICAIVTGLYVVFAYLGKRKIEREIS